VGICEVSQITYEAYRDISGNARGIQEAPGRSERHWPRRHRGATREHPKSIQEGAQLHDVSTKL